MKLYQKQMPEIRQLNKNLNIRSLEHLYLVQKFLNQKQSIVAMCRDQLETVCLADFAPMFKFVKSNKKMITRMWGHSP